MDPSVAYIKNNLYLPKNYLNVDALLRGLTFDLGSEKLSLATDVGHHVEVPKYFKTREELAEFPFDVVDESEKTYPIIEFSSKIKWRSGKQELAHSFLYKAHSGIFNLNPGRGKTVHALKRIEELKHPALIIVHNSYLAKQWLERIHDPKIDLTFKGKIGQIGAGKFDWQHPITIATIQTLANKIKTNKLPTEFSNWFGSAYYDEGHHLGAKVFSTTSSICWGRRICLTATPERADGLTCVLNYNMGNLIYSDLTWELTPKIYFKDVFTSMRISEKTPMPVIINKITDDLESNLTKLEEIRKDYDVGRKIICVSERIEQLVWFNSKFTDSCLIIGDTDPEERENLIKKSRISFVIMKLGSEGLDVDTLDCLHILSPLGADKTIKNGHTSYLGNRILQLIGRIMRIVDNKPTPKVVIYDNHTINNAHDLIVQLKRFFQQNNFSYEELD